MIVFFVMVGLVCFTAGALTVAALMSVGGDADDAAIAMHERHRRAMERQFGGQR